MSRSRGRRPRIPAEYDIARARPPEGKASFETLAQAEKEDRKFRLSSLRVPGVPASLKKRAQLAKRAKVVAARIKQALQGAEVDTLASAYVLRDVRRHEISFVWKLVDAGDHQRVTTFTLIPPKWCFTTEQLRRCDPRKLLRSVRQDLRRSGAVKSGGWLILYLHGEFNPITKRWHLHVHGIASDGMIDVVNALRKRTKYKRRSKGDLPPVRIRRKPLEGLPHPLTYLFQPYWPARRRQKVSDKSNAAYPRRRRIPAPYHAEFLAWIDQWKLADLRLLINLRVTEHGLGPTAKCKREGGRDM